MKVAVTGGTGYVGAMLVDALLQRGDEVWIISRSEKQMSSNPKLHTITWSKLAESPVKLEGIDAIVNLAGESISRRWTKEGKSAILQSRLNAARAIGKVVEALQRKPSVVVNASGISIYGTDRTKVSDEWSPAHITDFLATVVEKWEAAANRIEVKRLVKLRIGLVLGMKGGAFPKMLLPYRLLAGGRIGSGKQWIPWIHEDDMIRLILFCLDEPNIQGPVNACAPEPVTNNEFGRAIGKAMRRPHWFPVPAFVLKAVLGELSFLLLEGSRAVPRKALELGFEFRYDTVQDALRQLVSRK
ncbi:TIGR01777 family oxidoreductase [Paenibacillus lignilyticus]|uniref:TIGR01777 family oxidoreductase n=1 Tax=Paenibacillus lignilyticus TaxID=1172615 RepID=A0ABS5CIR0_9BACL|nr:TIGR01777 family oxidoreductase [Paenibacillus lignilyticus]MBP3965777.1 TIGR01777 family oxidoreductase [Paenibacillus lignilyticus]